MNTIADVMGVSVPVADQDHGLAFFVGQLGFEIRRDAQMGEGARWLTVAAPGANVEIAIRHDPTLVGHETGIRFAATDARAEHERLSREGVAVQELLQWPGVPPMFKFNDPDGNIYTIVEQS